MVWIDVEKFLYKGNVRFLGEMLSKYSESMFFFWLSLIQIELFKILGKLDLWKNKSP